MVYLPRLCDKIRLKDQGELSEDYHANMGKAMDLWACQLLGVEYDSITELVKKGSSDQDVLDWALENGSEPCETQIAWWNSYMRNRGLRDDLAEKLAMRIEESGFQDREILTFFDYIDADEER